MRFLEYMIAWIVEGAFFIFIACLIGAAIGELINRKSNAAKVKSSYRPPRFFWLEELRAMNHVRKIDRLAVSIERRLARKQRRAEAWQALYRDRNGSDPQ